MSSPVVITAVGPDNRGLADPIVHSVTGMGANIAEIQMYDHDAERCSRCSRGSTSTSNGTTSCAGDDGSGAADEAFDSHVDAGHRRAPAAAGDLRDLTAGAGAGAAAAIRDGQVKAEARLMIGNRDTCRGLAEQFGVPWFNIGDESRHCRTMSG